MKWMVGQRVESMRANCDARSSCVAGSGPVLAARIRQRLQVRPVLSPVAELLVRSEPGAREIDLLWRDQPDLVDQPREHAHRMGAAAEAEQIDVVAVFVIVDDKFVSREHTVIETPAGGEPEDGDEILLQLAPGVGTGQRADAGIVKHGLERLGFSRFPQASIKLEHIRDVLADLVARAVATDDDILHEEASRCYLGEHSSIWRLRRVYYIYTKLMRGRSWD
jgi:hypothetical protein